MLVKYFIRNISVKSCFEIEQAFLGGNVILSYFILALPNILLAKLNHLCYFGRGHYEEHFCEIILN